MGKKNHYRKSSKHRIIVALFASITFFFSVWAFLSYSVNPVIRKISQEKVRELSTVAINTAVSSVLLEMDTSYNSIIDISKNASGEIELIEVNSLKLNQITQKIIASAQSNISSLGSHGINVPLGSLSGLTFLAGRGPDVTIKVYPVGSVAISLDSEFISAGINQTRHRINLLLKSNISVIMPGSNRTITTSTQLTLVENIIVGKVPTFYLHTSALTDMLNLVA